MGSKNLLIGGINGTIIAKPCINRFQINDKSDFLLLGCNYIFNNILFKYR